MATTIKLTVFDSGNRGGFAEQIMTSITPSVTDQGAQITNNKLY